MAETPHKIMAETPLAIDGLPEAANPGARTQRDSGLGSLRGRVAQQLRVVGDLSSDERARSFPPRGRPAAGKSKAGGLLSSADPAEVG